MKLFLKIIIFVQLGAISASAAELPEASNLKLFDIGLGYPILNLRNGIKTSQRNYLSFNMNYQMFFNSYMGFVIEPNFWVVPIHLNDRKQKLFSVNMQTGFVAKIFPSFYLDPTLFALAGMGLSDAGPDVPSHVVYPISGKLTVNLYRANQRFEDNYLAFVASGGMSYYFRCLDTIMSPIYYNIGLAIRGSF